MTCFKVELSPPGRAFEKTKPEESRVLVGGKCDESNRERAEAKTNLREGFRASRRCMGQA